MTIIDTTTTFGQQVERRLRDEIVVWLTTVSKNDIPQPSPVWFLPVSDEEILIYSQQNRPKLRNIAAHSTVALSFNSSPTGGDVVVFHGEATIDQDSAAAVNNPAYIEKYREPISHLGMTPQSFSDEYSVPVRVQLTRLRGF